jgi:hypothetical protein
MLNQTPKKREKPLNINSQAEIHGHCFPYLLQINDFNNNLRYKLEYKVTLGFSN